MYNILVCDDDKEIVEAIDIYLTKEGYNVIKAYDGVEAMEKLKNEEIHLLLIDVMMPRLDGIRATLKIREESSVPIAVFRLLYCRRSRRTQTKSLDWMWEQMIMLPNHLIHWN